MFSVKEAKDKLFKEVKLLPAIIKNVPECTGYVLAENIKSPVDLPLFDQSAMDGFAVNFGSDNTISSRDEKISFRITGEIKAGDKPVAKLRKNNAVYIYTGAAIPLNADCIVMQEKAEVKGDRVEILKSDLIVRSNIRYKGTQIRKGDSSLTKGHLLNPASVGFLSSLGINKIKVTAKPFVSVLSTGNELRKPGEKLLNGQIYDSNSYMLDSVIKHCGFKTLSVNSIQDNKKLLSGHIKKMLIKSDVILISGGISVGRYDLVKDILEKHGVREIFYKISQKPGKPLYAGKYKNKLIFAVPGNPAAALVCFYEYVLPSLRKMSGNEEYELQNENLPLIEDYTVKGDRDLFLKAKKNNAGIKLLEGQGSDILRSFSEADALVYLKSGSRVIKKGSLVETHLLP